MFAKVLFSLFRDLYVHKNCRGYLVFEKPKLLSNGMKLVQSEKNIEDSYNDSN